MARAGWFDAAVEPERGSLNERRRPNSFMSFSRLPVSAPETPGGEPSLDAESPRALLHRLNNQLGVILAHAELIESKAGEASLQSRAGQVVKAALQAMAVSRQLRDGISD